MKFNAVTPVSFYEKNSVYCAGAGADSSWEKIGTLYCEWRGAFGDRAASAQALGVNESATVRTFYHPDIYSSLQGKQVVVIKNADASAMNGGALYKANPNVFELWGGVDNVLEENQYMEFKVRRYEGK